VTDSAPPPTPAPDFAAADGLLDVGPTGFRALIAAHPDAHLLDVRTPPEFHEGEYGRLDDATLIPVQELAGRLAELPDDRNAPILIYCRSGQRSLVACYMLRQAGFQRLANLRGGIIAWRDEETGQPPD
jgi:rhodanese-related sulfurtransferase